MEKILKENKEKFIKLLNSSHRNGIEELIRYLENETDFFVAPASTKYHLCCNGGLLQHSLNVYYNLKKEIESDIKEINEDLNNSIIIISLLHDICKANYYSVCEKNVKDKNGKWVKEQYYSVDDKLPLGHGEKSVMIIQQFIHLSIDEITAIRWHMGAFEPKDNYQYLSKVFSNSYLTLALHIADLKSTYIDENRGVHYDDVSIW